MRPQRMHGADALIYAVDKILLACGQSLQWAVATGHSSDFSSDKSKRKIKIDCRVRTSCPRQTEVVMYVATPYRVGALAADAASAVS